MFDKNKVSKSLHCSFWRNGQGNFSITQNCGIKSQSHCIIPLAETDKDIFSIILNCGWFFSKSPHYQFAKINLKLVFS